MLPATVRFGAVIDTEPAPFTGPVTVTGLAVASANAAADALDAPSVPIWLPLPSNATDAPFAVTAATVRLLPAAWPIAPPLIRSSCVNPPPPPIELMSSLAPGEPTVTAPAFADPTTSRSAVTLFSPSRVIDSAAPLCAPLTSSTGRPALSGCSATVPPGANSV